MINKKGWIRIVEASIAVLFIAGVVLVVINNNELGNNDSSLKILDVEISILREIQLNSSLRAEVLSDSLSLPIESENPSFPQKVKDKIDSKTPVYLICVSKICSIIDECVLTAENSGSVYAESILITTNPESSSYSPRKLKIFCWEK